MFEEVVIYPRLPDVRQPDVHKRPEERISCGIGVLECLWTYFGVKTRPVPVTPIDGVGPDTLESALWHSGLRVQAGYMDLQDLHYHTRRGRPVVCLVTEPEKIGHWVIVQGFRFRRKKLKSGRVRKESYVFLQCPTVGPYYESTRTFSRRWIDVSHRRGLIYKRWGIAVLGPIP